MKPSDIFKNRKIVRDSGCEGVWDIIKDKDCVVLSYIHKEEDCIIKDSKDKYFIVWERPKGMVRITKHYSLYHRYKKAKRPIKFKDKRLFKEFEEYLVVEGI